MKLLGIVFCIFCNPLCVLGMYTHLKLNAKKNSSIILRRCADWSKSSLFPSKATYIKLRPKLCIVKEHESTHAHTLSLSLSLSLVI